MPFAYVIFCELVQWARLKCYFVYGAIFVGRRNRYIIVFRKKDTLPVIISTVYFLGGGWSMHG